AAAAASPAHLARIEDARTTRTAEATSRHPPGHHGDARAKPEIRHAERDRPWEPPPLPTAACRQPGHSIDCAPRSPGPVRRASESIARAPAPPARGHSLRRKG